MRLAGVYRTDGKGFKHPDACRARLNVVMRWLPCEEVVRMAVRAELRTATKTEIMA